VPFCARLGVRRGGRTFEGITGFYVERDPKRLRRAPRKRPGPRSGGHSEWPGRLPTTPDRGNAAKIIGDIARSWFRPHLRLRLWGRVMATDKPKPACETPANDKTGESIRNLVRDFPSAERSDRISLASAMTRLLADGPPPSSSSTPSEPRQ
jgi:hypothetical protein